jgi:hypothetical protein
VTNTQLVHHTWGGDLQPAATITPRSPSTARDLLLANHQIPNISSWNLGSLTVNGVITNTYAFANNLPPKSTVTGI